MRVLFMCTANSCRSILSEALFNHLAPEGFEAVSAGSFPGGQVLPRSLATLERAGIAWRRIERRDDPEGYLRRIITNRYLNRVHALRRERLVGEVPGTGIADAEQSDDALIRLLSCLPRQQRAVMVMRYYLDQSEAQIAETLGCSAGTVKSTAARALTRLRRELASDFHQQSVEKGAR